MEIATLYIYIVLTKYKGYTALFVQFSKTVFQLGYEVGSHFNFAYYDSYGS